MAPLPRPSSSNVDTKEAERQKYKAQLATALNEEEDPLAVYYQFIQWTIKNYGEYNDKSGLKELLEDATTQFKNDSLYKTDLRYLKIWSLYARQVDRTAAISIYAYLLANGIGISYAALYEEYAHLLEKDGKLHDADAVYRKGISRNVRPLERLKNRYKEFQQRAASETSGTENSRSRSEQGRATSSSTSKNASAAAQPNFTTLTTTAAQRYATMLAPPPPGKRTEKLRFNLALLFTEDGTEYCIQEARARSMGLLGKKWPPLPVTSISSTALSGPATSSAMVDFNDDGQKSTRMMNRRTSLLGGTEPTVTINTKEALADVFGMYNSPEKTTKRMLPGSKHAPVKKIEPVTPIIAPRLTAKQSSENTTANAKTPTSGFRPFVDENIQSSRLPATKFTPFADENVPSGRTPSAKLIPFVDTDARKTPLATPRSVLSAKFPATTPGPIPRNENSSKSDSNVLKPRSMREDTPPEAVFSKVFIPAQVKSVPLAPLRDVFTDDHGKPIPKSKPAPAHERSKSHHDVLKPQESLPTFTPFVDENAKTPFKVFSRPPEQSDKVLPVAPISKTPAFTPFQDPKPAAFTPFRDGSAFNPFAQENGNVVRDSSATSGNDTSSGEEENQVLYEQPPGDGEYEDEEAGQYDEEVQEVQDAQYEASLASEHLPQDYEEGDSYQEIPLGGRFGRFTIMTPITERTCEFTTSTRGGRTPSTGSPRNDTFHHQSNEYEAAQAAKRLAAELQEDEEEPEDEEDEEPFEPLRLSANGVPQREDPEIAILEERTGALSLGDTLTLSSKFRPPNPCNPFDPPILTALLSRIPADPYFYDLRDQVSSQLEPLQKFSKKSRKGSDLDTNFLVTLGENRFNVSDKLGEGGFGSVFKARDLGARQDDDADADDLDEDMDDLDEENVSMVALKVVKPRNLWEYHVLRRLHSVLPTSLRRSVVLPHALYAFQDESFLVLDLCTQGMLLSIINNAVSAGVSQAGACLDELLVVFFSIELLKLVEAMHAAGFIHGDLKIDNCLLRLEEVPGGVSAWSAIYQPSGDGGWSCKGLKVIDFGRTIDTRLFPVGHQFIADWDTDERDCFEIRENRPWTYQTDYFGLAGIIYCMLFGKYLQASAVVEVPGNSPKRYKIGTSFKRYWQGDIWNRLFNILLNSSLAREDGSLPLCEELADVRQEMEKWLQANCNRSSNTLKGLLKKVEKSCYH
ncbi:Mad3/BUB1 homology region 1-domain-containing protein [Cyathus striatus]|nr:Mad3/BUB1 homology region 1-domain-containing protein [Cyathus striatus]